VRLHESLARVEQAAVSRDRAGWNFVRSILDAAAAGFSYREIAEHAGVSKARIGQIVVKSKKERD
jgi:AcrR family transcriptional regulator